MNAVLKKVHMYLGLLCCTALLVYSVAGLWATSFTRPADRPRPAGQTSFVDFTAPPNASDREVATAIWQAIDAPLSAPPPNFGRDDNHNLAFQVYSVNGFWRVTYLEKEKRARVERMPNRLGGYFMALHEMASRYPAPDLEPTLWKYYNEFAMWSLILMIFSGVYLWLSSRPAFRWAQLSFGVGTGGFLVLFWLAR